MKFNSHLCFFFLFSISFLLCSSYALNFQVGGSKGWVLQPNEDYNHWAARLRFQINDSLYFKYKKGSDSVLVVNKDDYLSCNTKNPILEMNDGYSSFKFDHSGPFYFISGNENNCKKGQKFIVVVMADRTSKYPKPPSSPATPPKSQLGPSAPPPKSQLGPTAPPPKSQFGPSAPPPKPQLGPSAQPPKSHLGPSAQPPKSKFGPSAPPTGAQGPSSSVPAMPPNYESPVSTPSTSPSPSSELPQPPSPSSVELSPSPSYVAPGPGENSTPPPTSSPTAANSPGTAGSGSEANLKAPAPATADNKKSAANSLVGLSVTLVLSLVLGSFVVGV